MLIKELIEKAFCEGYEYAQKEYAAANTLIKRGKNWDIKEAAPLPIRTINQFRQKVVEKTGSNDNAWVFEYAKKARNNSLGPRTIDQVRNISDNHAMRLTPKRAKIITDAVDSRNNISQAIQQKRKENIDLANQLKKSILK